jgi:hypothetical protein
MRIRLVVGELKKLNEYDLADRSKNGFCSFITTLQCRVNDETGELDLASEDLAKMRLYSQHGYRMRLQSIFQRSFGDKFDWSA